MQRHERKKDKTVHPSPAWRIGGRKKKVKLIQIDISGTSNL